MGDWGDTWDLPAYPQLPKLFTSAKTAKKRKHKEFILTDELLEQPVRLPKQQQQPGALNHMYTCTCLLRKVEATV
jgi:hypothetical protein